MIHSVKTMASFCIALGAFSLSLAILPAEVEFEKEVFPILKRHCVKCHLTEHTDDAGKRKKPKAGLVLESAKGILAGSNDGPVLMAERPNQSTLYTRTVLPHDDDDIMPPKGKPLTKKQTDLIRKWIAEGADFGGWKGKAKKAGDGSAKPPKPAPVAAQSRYAKLAALTLPPLPKKAVKNASSRFLVTPLREGSSLVRVEAADKPASITDRDLTLLKPLAPHISELILSRTGITDSGLNSINQFPHLIRLDLKETSVTASKFKPASKYLESINLTGTKASDESLKALAKIASLKALYLWKTDVTEPPLKRLKKQRPALKVISKDPFARAPSD